MDIHSDILIVGSGAAGLFCALCLPTDKRITILTKEDVERSDSFLAQGGICVLKSEDDYPHYFEDTMKAGHYENRKESVEVKLFANVYCKILICILSCACLQVFSIGQA